VERDGSRPVSAVVDLSPDRRVAPAREEGDPPPPARDEGSPGVRLARGLVAGAGLVLLLDLFLVGILRRRERRALSNP
jgi:hypothetical protein